MIKTLKINKDSLCSFFLWSIFLYLLIVIFSFALYKPLDRDEIESLHVGWKIAQGERIYVDFFEHHHPFFYKIISFLYPLVGENLLILIWARILIFFNVILIFYFTHRISKEFFDPKSGTTSLILLASSLFFVVKAVEVRPDVPQTLFCLISIYFFLRSFDHHTIKDPILSGISLGIAFLFLQKAAFLALLMLGIFIVDLFLTKEKGKSVKSIAVFLSGFAIMTTFFLLPLISKISFETYVACNWTANAMISSQNPDWRYVVSAFIDNFVLWSGWIISLLFMLKKPRQRQVGFITISLLTIIIFLSVGRLKQYYLLLIPLAAILAGHALSQIFVNRRWEKTVLLILCLIYPGSFFLSQKKNDTNLYKIAYVHAITKPKEYLYDPLTTYNLFRKDPDYFWFMAFLPRIPHQGYFPPPTSNRLRMIEEYKPKVIPQRIVRSVPGSGKNYARSDFYKDLYIRVP